MLTRSRSSRHFTNTYIKLGVGEDLQPLEWYRSPLWGDDHSVGLRREFVEEEIAWCGRPLGVARDWDNEELGGLYYSERTGDRCAQCKNGNKTWKSGNE